MFTSPQFFWENSNFHQNSLKCLTLPSYHKKAGVHSFLKDATSFGTSKINITKKLAQTQQTWFYLTIKQPFLPLFLQETGSLPTKNYDDPLMTYMAGKLWISGKFWHQGWGVRGCQKGSRFFSTWWDKSASLSVDCLLNMKNTKDNS